MDKILLIDAYNAVHRANISFGPSIKHEICTDQFHPLKHIGDPHCKCGSAWNTSYEFCYGNKYLIVYNFFRNLRPLIELFSPDKCFFVLEGRPQFRYDLYPGYKANRIIKEGSAKQETKDKVSDAHKLIVDLIQCLPITVCKSSKYEADDLIASLCDNLKEENLTIISNDSDYIQLLQRGYDNCSVYNPIKKTFMEAPAQFYILLKSLRGDKSDNIPRLVSDKVAYEYCNNPNKLKNFVSIEENRANLSINKNLVEFATVPLEEIFIKEGISNFENLKKEFIKMKFNSITNDASWSKYLNSFNTLKY